MSELTCFKAYDIRGRLGVDLDEGIAERIGRAFAQVLGARRVVIGRDCRASSEALTEAAVRGLLAAGAEVLDLGLCGTEEMYFATTHFGADGGIEVTASHNPMDYNGMKMVRAGSAPLGAENGLAAIKAAAERAEFGPARQGTRRPAEGARRAYVERCLSFVDIGALRPLKIVVNAGNGAAGPTFDAIAAALVERGAPLEFVRVHHAPDGSFPNGIPNPLLPENQPVTADAVRAAGADLGVAWDGDFDRCFFFDANGRFIDGEYIVGLLAAAFLEKNPGETVIHDPRIIWNTQDMVARAGGQAVQSRTGHAFIKQAMRDAGAIYGGEMSAHHYFRDFVYCDSGMIPWLLVAELIGRRGQGLAALVEARMAAFPSSGEINFRLDDPKAAITRVVAAYERDAEARDEMDGISVSFADWRFNLRSSNTEPVVRLNVESRGDRALVATKVAEIRALLEGGGGGA
ncbi:phosphomannomutase [Allgaiera indica]|uniref:Phosphomannomutase n=1 Tax=Allgaiera indica TaxID=765699 RepID=A0AAN4UPV1_9RHOB|nr:phosphomannomutase/phosphoglucomutase [Allgaiera indica]GHE00146.1 phosphomannomutase [Allgaiera indica]SDW36323.1 phosphomannomutase [Allgaiera indica]